MPEHIPEENREDGNSLPFDSTRVEMFDNLALMVSDLERFGLLVPTMLQEVYVRYYQCILNGEQKNYGKLIKDATSNVAQTYNCFSRVPKELLDSKGVSYVRATKAKTAMESGVLLNTLNPLLSLASSLVPKHMDRMAELLLVEDLYKNGVLHDVIKQHADINLACYYLLVQLDKKGEEVELFKQTLWLMKSFFIGLRSILDGQDCRKEHVMILKVLLPIQSSQLLAHREQYINVILNYAGYE